MLKDMVELGMVVDLITAALYWISIAVSPSFFFSFSVAL